MLRREFLKKSVPVLLLLANGKIAYAAGSDLAEKRKKSILRFAVASDGHYGQPETSYEDDFKRIVEQINFQHKKQPLQCTIINGDIIHNDPVFLPPAKQHLDQLKMPYYVTQGNHDQVNASEWQQVWQLPVNHSFTIKGQAFILATTSNIKGEYLCPDLSWLEQRLEEYRQAANIFIFIHITQMKWTQHGIDSPAFTDLLKKYKNIRAVFHGHDHIQDDIKVQDGIPYLFDGHFGGNWGTAYKGFRIVELLADNTIATYMLNPTAKLYEQVLT
jgi:3',5'-cyclic AMP phosphodiesterase CpdA